MSLWLTHCEIRSKPPCDCHLVLLDSSFLGPGEVHTEMTCSLSEEASHISRHKYLMQKWSKKYFVLTSGVAQESCHSCRSSRISVDLLFNHLTSLGISVFLNFFFKNKLFFLSGFRFTAKLGRIYRDLYACILCPHPAHAQCPTLERDVC